VVKRRILKIEIVKRADGAGLLRCTRADGTVTWQKQSERHALHFTHHDLTHFAVETTLGYGQGFFGLIASGWDIEDTTGKGLGGRSPMKLAKSKVSSACSIVNAVRGRFGLRTNSRSLRREG
jgi:uncharacterized C2H2 Zn-finger protein